MAGLGLGGQAPVAAGHSAGRGQKRNLRRVHPPTHGTEPAARMVVQPNQGVRSEECGVFVMFVLNRTSFFASSYNLTLSNDGVIVAGTLGAASRRVLRAGRRPTVSM